LNRMERVYINLINHDGSVDASHSF